MASAGNNDGKTVAGSAAYVPLRRPADPTYESTLLPDLRTPRISPFVPRDFDAAAERFGEVLSKLGEATETRAERIVRLQSEARALGCEMVEDALAQAERTVEALRCLTDAGDAVSDGLREAARTLVVDLESRVTTMRQIQGRAGQ